ncbi:MAG: ROK family protein [Acidobacteria bacterium]|nr:ROK family protein [Acidobacteriota bacterium]
MDLAGNIHRRSSENLEIHPGLSFQRFLSELKSFVANLGDLEASRILAVGIGTPEVLDRQAESMISSSRISWLNIPIRRITSQEVKLPVYLARSVDVAMLAENWFGAAKTKRNSLIITFGGGIGCGVLLDNQLYTGSAFMAGEFGHTTLEPLGIRCYCGKQGCLEMYVSEKEIVENYLETQGGSSSSKIVFQDVVQAARSGDSMALDVIKKSCYYLGLGISDLIQILNPEQIILGGSMAEAGDLFLPEIEKVVSKHTMPMLASLTQIVCSTLGPDAGIKGAAASALHEVVYSSEGIERLLHPTGKALIPRSQATP